MCIVFPVIVTAVMVCPSFFLYRTCTGYKDKEKPLVRVCSGATMAGRAEHKDIRTEIMKSFPELSGEETARLAGHTRLVSCGRGDWILTEGKDVSTTAWLICGHVELLKGSVSGKSTILHIVRDGHFLDLYGIFGSGGAFLSARALSACTLLIMDNSVLRSLLAANSDLSMRVMRALAMRQRMFINKIAVSQGKISVPRRVAGWLLHKARVEKSAVLDDGTTREVLAGLLGLSRESLSRQLSRFSRQGIIRLERKSIVILNEEALRRCLLED